MRLLIGQTGGPTAVVNRSLGAFVETAAGHDLLAFVNGPTGLVERPWVKIDERQVLAHQLRPGSMMGGGRRSVTQADIEKIVDRLATEHIDGLALIGGNGTMSLLHAIENEVDRLGLPIMCVGIPKTIDNDLVGADPAPGYSSAAAYIARTIADVARDHAAMQTIERVRIVETMGRSVGWLALAGTMPIDPGYQADLVLLPEQPWDANAFVSDVENCLAAKGRALVVVSEGVAPELTNDPVHDANHTTLIQGGLSRSLASMINRDLKAPARGEVLGTAQRSASWAVSEHDAASARSCGRLAAQWLTGLANNGHMASPDGEPIALSTAAGVVRGVPSRWQRKRPRELGEFHEWLKPLISPLDPLNKE